MKETNQETNLNSDKEPLDKKQKRKMIIKEILWYLGIVFVCLFVMPKYVAEGVAVNGPSMENTLHSKEKIVVEKFTTQFGELKRFDIVVFDPPEEYKEPEFKYWIKRVIGLPGETIQIIDETIYINGKPLEEHYGKEPIEDPGLAEEPIVLGEDEYFVMGDNRNDSTDSRVIGPVSIQEMGGKACFRIWPLDEVGTVGK